MNPTQLQRKAAAIQFEVFNVFRRSKRLAVVPWLEQNIILPRKMAPNSAGPFRTATRPFQRPILECFNPESAINECGVSAGVQIAKTTMLTLGAAYRICNAPMPILIVGSSEKWTKSEISEKRLQPLIDENPVLAAKKPANSDRYRALAMDMEGGFINLVGGNSPGALSGGSYGITLCDEAAKLIQSESDQAPEAHPFHLIPKRTDGFGALEFHYYSSTPNSPSHPFWQYILAGDQTHFHVECPHCHQWFYLDFIGRPEDVEEYSEGLGISIPRDYQSLIWDPNARDASGQWDEGRVRETVRYICPHNGCQISELHKQSMVEGCVEKKHNPRAASNRRTFILPSFYSPTKSFGTMAWDFLDARKDMFGLQDFYNSRLARPWTQYSVQVKMEHIIKCIADGKDGRPIYRRGTLPFRPLSLLLNCDPGEATSHWELVAVAKDGGIWVCDWGTLVSSKDLLAKDFLRARHILIDGTGEKMWAQRGYLDTGWQQDDQLDVCAASKGFFIPVKGSDAKHGQLHETRVATRPSMKLLVFNDTEIKNMLYANRFMKNLDGGFHLPCDADPEVKLGHTGQKRDDHGDWQRVPHDHYGDCSKYACVDFQTMRAAGIVP
ncbi:MAG: hypothetical protein KCHDKBKB_03016 [Elusimicrobia bacterium]|nr:hypothetical protein [Elusimicrobiota bacterium]